MSAQVATRYITEEEYRDAEEIASQKHEWFEGELFPMPGGTNNHTILVGNIYSVAKNAARGTNYRARNSEQRVKVAATGLETYPDAVVFEHPGSYIGRGSSTLLTPKVIFEVLSQSMEKYDRRGKWEQYKRIETFTDYVLIDQESISVEHFARHENGWNYRLFIRRSDVLTIDSIGISLPLSEIYEELALPEPLLIFEPGEE